MYGSILHHFHFISSKMKGFIFLVVNDVCNEDITIPKGGFVYISSPKYPNNYPDDKKCVWRIKNANTYKVLTMQILELDTEEGNDIVEVRDGYTAADYVLARASGKKIPPPIFSSKDKLWIKFQSNFEKNKKGFRAIIRSGIININILSKFILTRDLPFLYYLGS